MQDEKDIKKEISGTPDDSWGSDQVERGYYYDDAHGYERFDPESDEVDEGESESNGSANDTNSDSP